MASKKKAMLVRKGNRPYDEVKGEDIKVNADEINACKLIVELKDILIEYCPPALVDHLIEHQLSEIAAMRFLIKHLKFRLKESREIIDDITAQWQEDQELKRALAIRIKQLQEVNEAFKQRVLQHEKEGIAILHRAEAYRQEVHCLSDALEKVRKVMMGAIKNEEVLTLREKQVCQILHDGADDIETIRRRALFQVEADKKALNLT